MLATKMFSITQLTSNNHQIIKYLYQNSFSPSDSLRRICLASVSCSSTSSTLQNAQPQTQPAKKESTVLDNINQQIKTDSVGRMFAVVHLCGKQFKVTAGDIVMIEGYWPPTIGDRIRLDKVLVAGASDFSLIGRPVLQKGLVDVQATIIEKTLSHTKTHFKKKRRKQFMRINFFRGQHTMVRINSIELGQVKDGAPSTDGVENVFEV
jgi:ribosomal protein L21